VSVIGQTTVGPYETVQIQSTDPGALEAWLTSNGYVIPSDVQPVVAAYVQEGFDFLAMKLAPGESISAMRPVRVSSPGAGLTLPLRMVAAGSGATVGVTLWILADGGYAPQNFPTFQISPSDLVWNWSTQSSNFTTLAQQQEAANGYGIWQSECSMGVNPVSVEQGILSQAADDEYLPIPASGGDGGTDGAASEGDAAGDASLAVDAGGAETADEVRQDDLAILFPAEDGTQVWMTRIRADLARSALATDLILAGGQGEVSNVYQAAQQINVPECPSCSGETCPPCPAPPTHDAGATSGAPSPAAPSASRGGCATASQEPAEWGFELGLAGLTGLAIVRNGRRRRRSRAARREG
jgi:hypothetical protein